MAKQKTIAARYILHVVVAVRAFFLFTAVCPLKMVKRKRNSSVVAEKQVAAEVVDEEVPLIRVSDEPVVKKLKVSLLAVCWRLLDTMSVWVCVVLVLFHGCVALF